MTTMSGPRTVHVPALAWAFLKRDILIALSYKTAFIGEALGVLLKVTTFYYISAVFSGALIPNLAKYNNDYFAYLMIGVALMDFMYTSLETFDNNIRESQLMGTLEIVLLTPVKLSHMLLFSSLWPYISTTLTFLTYLFFGVVLFDLAIGNRNPLSAAVILLLGGRIAAVEPGLLTGAAFPWYGWIMLVLIPLAVTGLAMLMARWTVISALKKTL